MYKFAAGVLIGLVSGLIGGYFIAKKEYGKKLDSIKQTNEDIKKFKESAEEKPAEDKAENSEADKKDSDDDSENSDDSDDSDDDLGDVEPNPEKEKLNYADEEYDDEDDYYLETESERAYRLQMERFQEEIESYEGTGQSYNITKDMYESRDGYDKKTMYIHPVEDRAYDADNGMEIDDYHDLLMDEDNGTLADEREDEYGGWFIRCEKLGTDFHVYRSMLDWE